ncbi:RNA polymerase sigma factor [Actinomarinicola tropica]|uniref:RNA polymerase sigma factor 70 region 4 type 2 domain-containing protein n=1 Tax=Actinomarinicola tropica TaxID=2789776 RepID=A0A5Q2RHL4_9ACTN|nr:sigma factor-like helix-turn-helix DNA-binding protein [Actinomarinicola tropica]QGG95074.1 hypothetical protein GH723_08125 [Actinomarinicola tropica]
MDVRADEDEFVAFVGDVEPRLRRALVALRGADRGRDAAAEALAWAWEHWAEVRRMQNPAGYLYRVGQSRSRARRIRLLPARAEAAPPDSIDLVRALRTLTERQRTAVVLVHGCGWSYDDVAEALEVSKSSVGTHVQRGLERLRDELGEEQA